jgi:hypothetical protein
MQKLPNSLEASLGMETHLLSKPEQAASIEIEYIPTEASYSQTEVHSAAKESLDFLSGLALPTTMTFGFPPVFLGVWSWLLSYIHLSRDFSKLALGLPRGFGKTTLIKIFILYCILFTKRNFILVVAANAKLAENIVADVCDMLDEPNIKRVFGDWRLGLEKDTQGLKKFGFRGRNIIIAGLGQSGSLRGLNIKNARPDVMIFEDIQTREDAESAVTSESIERWMYGTAMKAKDPTGCLYIFVANMYPTKWSLLRRLKHNPSWTKFIAGGILADGTSLWEDLQPIKQLLQEYETDLNSGHPEIFYSEVLNDENASVNNYIDLSKIPDYPFQDTEFSAGSFIVIDPATDKASADAVSIGLFQIYNGKPTITVILEGRFSPGDTIREALKLALKYNTSLIAVEANAYQYSLCYWFGFICEQMSLTGIDAVPIYSGSFSKNSRILSMFKELLTGEIVIHPDCKSQCFQQISQFNALKRDNTDGILDLLTYAPRVISEFSQYITVNNPLGAEEFDAATVWATEDNSLF